MAISSGVSGGIDQAFKNQEKKWEDWAQGIQTDAFKDGFHLTAGTDLNMEDQQRNEKDLLACERQAMRGRGGEDEEGGWGRLKAARTIVRVTGISHGLQG